MYVAFITLLLRRGFMAIALRSCLVEVCRTVLWNGTAYYTCCCCDVGTRVPKRLTEVVKVIDLARANNVSIMLTQFHAFKGGAPEVRQAVLTGSKLGLERLSLLLQVCPAAMLPSLHVSGNVVYVVYRAHLWMSAPFSLRFMLCTYTSGEIAPEVYA